MTATAIISNNYSVLTFLDFIFLPPNKLDSMSLISKFCQRNGPQVFFKYSSQAPKVIPPLLTEVLLWQCQRGQRKYIFLSDPSPIFGNACHSLTHCRLVNLIDVTLACKDAYSKLAEVVTVAYVDDENRVGNSFLQIWK